MKTASPSRIAARAALVAIVALTTVLLTAQAALAVPPTTEEFTVSPSPPARANVDQPVTLTAKINWGGAGVPGRRVDWAFGDGLTATVLEPAGETVAVAHRYDVTGPRTITMTPTNSDGSGAEATRSVIINAPPVADFTFGPVSPLPGEDVLFASESADPDDSSLEYSWDFNGNGTSTLRNPRHPFATPGTKSVTLTVEDPHGAVASISKNIVVGQPPIPPRPPAATPPVNAPPSVGFAFSPRSPQVGEGVEFASSATDPEGQLRDQRWDLDGDSQFDDGRGDEVLYTFATPGAKTVRLRVEDAAGKAAVRERTINVVAAEVARPGFLSPFPVVRINGEVRKRGAKVRLLSVRAPRGSLVRVGCSGKRCPVRSQRRTVRKRPLRFRTFERVFRAGTRLTVRVTKAGTIGKYTSFAIRAGASPKRRELCLPPGSSRPRRCGSL